MNLIDTTTSTYCVKYVYVSLDTLEGGCVGHWLWECAFFLPIIKEFRDTKQHTIKILLHTPKKYKTNMLSDFEFYDDDIIYSNKMLTDPYGKGTWQEKCVFPEETEYKLYIPKFFYLWNTTIHTSEFFTHLTRFRNYFLQKLSNTTKTFQISYVARSKVENYANNFREFMNKDEVCDMLEKHKVHIIDTDCLTSFSSQFNDIIKTNTIILEMGSAFTINVGFIASNSHIIIINDNWGFHSSSSPFFHIFRKLMAERNNTIEIFSTGDGASSFHVDTQKLHTCVSNIFLVRKFCIICNHSEFESINAFPNFPIMAISNSSVKEQFFDFNLLVCKKCSCLQIKNHVDPSILYSDVYMNAYFSPIWKDHHEHFASFILNNTRESSFLEIGANRGDLYKLMNRQKEINYTTLDMFHHPELPSQIKFIGGDCNSFDFTGFQSIIASHVFEHLYSPLTCIANFRNASVSEIFISIPNFEHLLKEQSTILIHSQHIFYCGYDYILYMFSLFEYRCNSYVSYDGKFQSNMFHFVLDTTISQMPIPSTNIQLYKDIYIEKVNYIKNIQLPHTYYIAPSGIYGQFFYYFLQKKDAILGFLDNNSERHKKKLYGTEKLVYSPHEIDYSNVTIIVCDCPYKEEIIAGLNKLCDHIQYLYV